MLTIGHKKFKLQYFTQNFIRMIMPFWVCQILKRRILSQLRNYDQNYISSRVGYYNKLVETANLSNESQLLSEFKFKGNSSSYFFDANEFTRLFPKTMKINFLFGDIIHVPEEVSIVKSRPINIENSNSVLLNLDKFRHFNFIKDHRLFESKKNILVGRGRVEPGKEIRIKILKKYFKNKLCDIGKTNKGDVDDKWLVDRMTINEQLDYKFILCWEGHDVATNLKWVMSSNSIAVMPKPTCETWFMEGRLIPDYHYIAINDSLSNLEEKLKYYTINIEASKKIIENAHNHVNQFKDSKREGLISTLVLEKYFLKTNQSGALAI